MILFSLFMTYHWILARVTRQVPLMEQELLTLPQFNSVFKWSFCRYIHIGSYWYSSSPWEWVEPLSILLPFFLWGRVFTGTYQRFADVKTLNFTFRYINYVLSINNQYINISHTTLEKRNNRDSFLCLIYWHLPHIWPDFMT